MTTTLVVPITMIVPIDRDIVTGDLADPEDHVDIPVTMVVPDQWDQ
jgi:hypothetical protein